jgi:putative Holliday junction resolvase
MRALGIDLGAKRIGLALTDPTGTLATPWQVLQVPHAERVTRLADIVRAFEADEGEGIQLIVLGLPRHMDGREHDLAADVRAFARRLHDATGLPVVLQDERLTSREAESRLALRERDWRKRKARLDAAAAAVILQDYVDEQQRLRRRGAAGTPDDADDADDWDQGP